MRQLIISNGTFRLGVHRGHIDFFDRASELGEVTTFIDSKIRVSQIKPGAFCLDDVTREKIVNRFCDQLVYDSVIFNSEEELKGKISDTWNHFKNYWEQDAALLYAKGSDYKIEDLTLKPFIESLGGKVVIIPLLEGYSTSAIIKEIKEGNYT